MQTSSSIRRRGVRRILLPLLAVTASVLVCLLLAELALRALGYDPQLSQPQYVTCWWRVVDPALIMVDPRLQADATYAVPEGADVVVALGDSFTYGYPVTKEHSYPSLLQSQLRATGWNVHVINLGLGNSGPDQHLVLFEKYALKRVRPKHVVWLFYSNDLSDNIRQPTYDIVENALVPMDGTRHWMAVRRRFADAFPASGFLTDNSRLFRLALKSFESSDRVVDAASRDWAGLKIALEVERMQRLAKEHDFKLHCALLVPQADYLRMSDPERWSRHYVVQEHILLREALRGASGMMEVRFDEAPELVFAGGDRDGNPEGDRHLNERGYRLLAERMAVQVLGSR